MEPIVILRHIECESAGYLADYLTARSVPFHVIRVDQGDNIPHHAENISGLVLMGGPMSANDRLPFIEKELHLIRTAHELKLPILGHCLGAQLISKALGGKITANPVPEIGWYQVSKYPNAQADSWLSNVPEPSMVFHWHRETFSLPKGAAPLLHSAFCRHQAFVIDNTLALQCHVEMQANMVRQWLNIYRNDLPEPLPSVQSQEQILANLAIKISRLKEIAQVIYTRWLACF